MSNSITYLGKTYSDNEIISGSFSRRQSLSMSELSVDTMEITVRPYLHLEFFTHEPLPMYTRDKLRFQTSEANPFAEQFQQNTPIVQYADGSQTAIWYLQSIDRMGTNIYKLSGFSSLGRLTQVTHYGGIYDGSQTVADVVQDIVGDIPYYISTEFRNIALYGWLPIASARDNLQQVLFAVNASLQTDEQGILRIQNLSTATQASVAQTDIFQSGASVKYNTPITKVVVVEHQYAQGTGTKQLYSGTATGNQLIAFDEPVSNLTASGLTIVSSGANYAIVSGSGTLTGTPYIHTMREIEREVSTTATVENIVRVDNATLVGITASSDVAHRLAEYYACRNEINVAVAQAFLNCGSVIDTFDPYDEVMRSACIESEQVSLSSAKKSTISALVGFSPWQTIPFQDVREVLTGVGTWAGPSNLPDRTEITLVLIGKGENGAPGGDGAPGGNHVIIETGSGTWSVSYKDGGDGGIGGEGGLGGKIYRTTFVYSSGQSFAYDTTSEDSVFGSYSSSSGERSSSGYFDPVSGDTYAQKGEQGINGAKGGHGGATSSTRPSGGQMGKSVTGSDGTIYQGGVPGGGHSGSAGTSYSRGTFGGGGGGGAAVGNNGHNAPDGTYNGGGKGADAVAPSQATGIGTGGTGGNGGGGGGGTGAAWITQPQDYGVWYDPAQAQGGAGSIGGEGATGGCFLYYRLPLEE